MYMYCMSIVGSKLVCAWMCIANHLTVYLNDLRCESLLANLIVQKGSGIYHVHTTL